MDKVLEYLGVFTCLTLTLVGGWVYMDPGCIYEIMQGEVPTLFRMFDFSCN